MTESLLFIVAYQKYKAISVPIENISFIFIYVIEIIKDKNYRLKPDTDFTTYKYRNIGISYKKINGSLAFQYLISSYGFGGWKASILI